MADRLIKRQKLTRLMVGLATTAVGALGIALAYKFSPRLAAGALMGVETPLKVGAVVCVLLALPLFIGFRFDTPLTKKNWFGIFLIALALAVHGAFEVFLGSSPRSHFNGYVLGWEGGTESDDSSLWIYDLGYPPRQITTFPDAPSLELHLRHSRRNAVPEAFWRSDTSSYFKIEYRLWDLQIIHVEAVPVSNLPGVRGWTWSCGSTGRGWPFLEAMLGLLLLPLCAVFAQKSSSLQSASLEKFANGNRWALSIYVGVAILIVSWVAFARLANCVFQYRAETLLHEIQRLQVQKSTWQDTERLRLKYVDHLTVEQPCSKDYCDFRIRLEYRTDLAATIYKSAVGRTVWILWRLAGGRWAMANATVRVRNGVVWGKGFEAIAPHREGYALIARVRTVDDFPKAAVSNNHVNLRFGRPGGCEICQMLWAEVTPYANDAELRQAFSVDLSCIGTKLRTCTDIAQMMPIAARAVAEELDQQK